MKKLILNQNKYIFLLNKPNQPIRRPLTIWKSILFFEEYILHTLLPYETSTLMVDLRPRKHKNLRKKKKPLSIAPSPTSTSTHHRRRNVIKIRQKYPRRASKSNSAATRYNIKKRTTRFSTHLVDAFFLVPPRTWATASKNCIKNWRGVRFNGIKKIYPSVLRPSQEEQARGAE